MSRTLAHRLRGRAATSQHVIKNRKNARCLSEDLNTSHLSPAWPAILEETLTKETILFLFLWTGCESRKYKKKPVDEGTE